MKKPALLIVIGVVALLGCVGFGLIVSKRRMVLPIRVSIRNQPVRAPGTEVWVRALQRRVSPAELERIVRTNPTNLGFALGLFAYNGMTNDVRILVEHGADTSDAAMGALEISGLSNAASLIRSVVSDVERKSSNLQGGANGKQPFSPETNLTSAAAASRRSP